MEYVKINIRVLTESWMRERKGTPRKYDSRFAAGIVTICCQQYTVKLLAKSLTSTTWIDAVIKKLHEMLGIFFFFFIKETIIKG